MLWILLNDTRIFLNSNNKFTHNAAKMVHVYLICSINICSWWHLVYRISCVAKISKIPVLTILNQFGVFKYNITGVLYSSILESVNVYISSYFEYDTNNYLKSRLNYEGFFLYMFIIVRCTMYGNKVSVDLSYLNQNLKIPIRIHECKAIFKHCKRRTLAETAPLQERWTFKCNTLTVGPTISNLIFEVDLMV